MVAGPWLMIGSQSTERSVVWVVGSGVMVTGGAVHHPHHHQWERWQSARPSTPSPPP